MRNRIRKLFFTLVFMSIMLLGSALAEEAKSLDVALTCSDGDKGTKMRDKSYESISKFKAGDTITIDFTEKAQGLYVIWGKPVSKWKLTVKSAEGETEFECGLNGYLHEYIDLSEMDTVVNGQVKSLVINFLEAGSICDLYVYGEGDLPDDVQIWEPSCSPDKPADILVFSTHADDEILFLGGVLVEYAGQENLRTQLVYMTHYWSGPYMAPIREHEKLDGIWHCGVRQYPVNLSFEDLYCKTLESALGLYKYEDILSEVTEKVRYFKPLIAVTQDFNGEYGHGGHMILAKAVAEAVEKSADASFEAESAASYGTYDVPKAYFHLYKDKGAIEMDLRKPLSAFGGKTGVEVAAEAYKKHVSQQWCWYYVSDDYEYSVDEFGLYRLAEGQADDGSADMMNNLTSYEVVEEEERKKAQEEEEARLTQAAKLTQAAEDARKANDKNTTPASSDGNKQANTTPAAKSSAEEKENIILKVLMAALIVAVITGGIIVGRKLILEDKRREEEELAKRKETARARKKARETEDGRSGRGEPEDDIPVNDSRVRRTDSAESEKEPVRRTRPKVSPEGNGERRAGSSADAAARKARTEDAGVTVRKVRMPDGRVVVRKVRAGEAGEAARKVRTGETGEAARKVRTQADKEAVRRTRSISEGRAAEKPRKLSGAASSELDIRKQRTAPAPEVRDADILKKRPFSGGDDEHK